MQPLASIIAAALAMPERAALATVDAPASQWRTEWARTASRGRLAWGAPAWSALGIDLEAIDRGLADVNVDVDASEAPEWAAALQWFLRQLPEEIAEPAPGPLGAVTTSGYLAGLACLADLRAAGLLPPIWAQSADPSAALALAGSVLAAQARALQPEVIAARALGQATIPAEPQDWLDRLEDLPGLARPIGLAVLAWRSSVLEVVDRWERDFGSRPDDERRIVDIRLGLGDPHQGGRSVAMLRTGAGSRHLHKPKPQGGPAIWQEIVTALLGHPACTRVGIRFRTREIRDCGEYGWDAYVARDAQWDADADESRTWLRSFGALVRVCELLECRDMWLDNLVTNEGIPVYIDVETVLQPRQQSSVVLDLLSETALPTGSISLPTALPNGMTEDIGVMHRPGWLTLPFRREDLGGSTPIGEFGEDGIMRWEPEPWRPVLAPGVNAVDELLIGYDAVDDALGDPHLVEMVSDLVRELAAQPSRVVLRSTFTCYSLMQDSLRPEVLHDGRARDIALAALLAPAVEALVEHDAHDMAAWLAVLGAADAAALGRLDVPLVRHDPRSGALTLDDATIVPAPSGRRPALDLCLERLTDPRRLRTLRRAVVTALTEFALAAGEAPDTQAAAVDALHDAIAAELTAQGVDPASARIREELAAYGYAGSAISSC